MFALILILVIGDVAVFGFPLAMASTNPDKVESLSSNNSDTIPQDSKEELFKQANSFLTKQPTSVMDKTQLPASGNRHDFLELGPYCWPDSTSPNGLPYICEDAKGINPEFKAIPDYKNMLDLIERTYTLALAYHISQNDSYASKATELLRVWFLNNNTKMNPNMQYSEVIPGLNNGSHTGIITAHGFTEIIDALGLIENSPSWTRQDQQGMKIWFSDYLDWLMNSNLGIQEGKSRNNHGTYYAVQVSTISLFLNKTDITKRILQKVMDERIPVQILSDGRQPLELKRQKSLDYSSFNLVGLFELAKIGDLVGIDLWNFKTSNGASLQKALDYLLPYLLSNTTSPYVQKAPSDWGLSNAATLLREASIHYPDNELYMQAYKSMDRKYLNAYPFPEISGVLNNYFLKRAI
jgi:alginate lyase